MISDITTTTTVEYKTGFYLLINQLAVQLVLLLLIIGAAIAIVIWLIFLNYNDDFDLIQERLLIKSVIDEDKLKNNKEAQLLMQIYDKFIERFSKKIAWVKLELRSSNIKKQE